MDIPNMDTSLPRKMWETKPIQYNTKVDRYGRSRSGPVTENSLLANVSSVLVAFNTSPMLSAEATKKKRSTNFSLRSLNSSTPVTGSTASRAMPMQIIEGGRWCRKSVIHSAEAVRIRNRDFFCAVVQRPIFRNSSLRDEIPPVSDALSGGNSHSVIRQAAR